MASNQIAGLSMKGGRKENFFFCLIEHFPQENRWFLRSLLQVKDEEGKEGDEAIRSWIKDYEIDKMIVDFPLTSPACQTCELDCPGIDNCPELTVNEVKKTIEEVLGEDEKLYKTNPKKYEQERNRDDEYDFNKDLMAKESYHHILSRSFKRRLKKGFVPYWNRSLDLWVWLYFYDQLLEFFNCSYDSFGNTSLMILSRFSYLKRHFPKGLELFEGNNNIALIELLRAGVIQKKDIQNLSHLELGIEAKLDIIKKIEKKLNIFIYDNDLEMLVKNPRAFESFLLAVTGQRILLDKHRKLPDWTLPKDTKFIVPDFS
jgi:hypothetical protein